MSHMNIRKSWRPRRKGEALRLFLNGLRRGLLYLLLFGLLPTGAAVCATPDPSGEAVLRMEERRRAIAQRMESSTVFILTSKDGELQGLGTGFVVADGYVMTNAHVVAPGDEWYVAREGIPPVKARLIKSQYDKGATDYALLRLSSKVSLPPLTFHTQVGRMDRVSAWGFPYIVTQFDQNMSAIEQGEFKGVPPLVYTEGVVSTLVRNGNYTNIIHTAVIASGNSGGPLINSWGEVVGINTWTYKEEDEGAVVNASLPADRMVAFLKSCGVEPLLSQRSSSPLQAALAPASSAASSPAAESALPQQKPRRGIATSPKGTAGDAGGQEGSQAGGEDADQRGRNDSDVLPMGMREDLRDIWRAASRGHAPAQAAIGLAYYTGDGAPKDMPTAVKWLRRAHTQDNPEATYLLGFVHVVDADYKDMDKGLEFLRKAADADADYASTLAVLLLGGEVIGVERNAEMAVTYAQRGAEINDADAVAALAFLTYFGLGGLEADNDKALQLAQKAAKEENALALTVLGWMAYMGEGIPLDVTRALSYATDAAESDEGHAMGLLAFMYYVGEDDLPEDKEKAEAWALRAAEYCNEYGQYVLGMLYKEQKSEQKKVEAWAYLDMAARYLVSAEKERDTLSKKLSRAQLKSAKALSAKRLKEFGLPPNTEE